MRLNSSMAPEAAVRKQIHQAMWGRASVRSVMTSVTPMKSCPPVTSGARRRGSSWVLSTGVGRVALGVSVAMR